MGFLFYRIVFDVSKKTDRKIRILNKEFWACQMSLEAKYTKQSYKSLKF